MEVGSTTFVVKYLGFRTTSHLWGIKYTRNPVDEMVKQAKLQLTSDKQPLALLKLQVSSSGIHVSPMPQNQNPSCPTGRFPIEAISYGVQDIVYTRVFAMIVVNENQKVTADSLPFRCHAFVCDSRETARKLTIELASAFEVYSKRVKGEGKDGTSETRSTGSADGESDKGGIKKKKKFAIDLRSPEEIRKEDGAAGEGEPSEEFPDFSEA
ncbi:unnamed protein product [Orchesella dallaii]|uniref:PID domain-containing protein n=1 Tax=Orchesella dallaii TaxID=48710 RepID=A0ABP1QP70_9HEXA